MEDTYKDPKSYTWYDLLTISGYLVTPVDGGHFDLANETDKNIGDLGRFLVGQKVGFELDHENKTLKLSTPVIPFDTWLKWMEDFPVENSECVKDPFLVQS